MAVSCVEEITSRVTAPDRLRDVGDVDGDQSGRLLEVGVMTDMDPGIDVIIHAMLARRRFPEWRP